MNPFSVCSGGGERGVRQARPDGVVGMEHQRRPLHRRRHGRDQHRHRPKLQPGNQVRMLRPEQHRLPRHKAVSTPHISTSQVLPLGTAGVRRIACRRFRCAPRGASTSFPLYLTSATASYRIKRCSICQLLVFISDELTVTSLDFARCRKIYALNAVGVIPEELQNLTRLTNLYELLTFLCIELICEVKHGT